MAPLVSEGRLPRDTYHIHDDYKDDCHIQLHEGIILKNNKLC